MDTIESRLKQFIHMEGISPATFADTLGMQRSGISHLINGRNKPSYDFISRMLNAFPDLNADWLILGKGKPYKNSSSKEEIKENQDADLQFDGLFAQERIEPTTEFSGEYAESQLNAGIDRESQPRENPIFVPTPTTDTAISNSERPKSIDKIIIFYSDGSYEER